MYEISVGGSSLPIIFDLSKNLIPESDIQIGATIESLVDSLSFVNYTSI